MDKGHEMRNAKLQDNVDYLNFGKKKSPNTRTSVTTQPATIDVFALNEDDIEPIELEDAPADFLRHDSLMVALLKRRVKKTIDAGIEVGKAFPVPAKSKHSISEFLKKEYPHMRFRVSHPKGQPFARLIRMA